MSINFGSFLIAESAREALVEKAEKHGVSFEVLEEVFKRGIVVWSEETNKTPQQYAFNRVDSFIAKGYAADMDFDLLDEGRKINSKMEYQVVNRSTQKAVKTYTQKHRAMYHAKSTKHAVHTMRGGDVVQRQDHNGRTLDHKGHIVESKHYIEARQKIHDAHHEISRQLAGRERDPELRRIDLHRSKKHAHASRVLEILKTRKK